MDQNFPVSVTVIDLILSDIMDIQTFHTEVELTHLLRIIQDVKAKVSVPLRCRYEYLERSIIFAERTMKKATAVIEGELGHEERVRESVQECIIVVRTTKSPMVVITRGNI